MYTTHMHIHTCMYVLHNVYIYDMHDTYMCTYVPHTSYIPVYIVHTYMKLRET